MGKKQNPRRTLEENINFSKRKYREQIKKRKKNQSNDDDEVMLNVLRCQLTY